MPAEHSFDLIVLGAGPAGGHAALAAASCGMRVILLDEQAQAGGQVWRAHWHGLEYRDPSPDARAGDAMRARLTASGITTLYRRRVWSIVPGFQLDAVGPDGHERVQAPRLIAATGAHERIVPFPGWTLPGVIGLGAATVLLKSHAVVPGRSVLVAGSGPLLAAVAAGIIKAGGHVVAVADLDGRADWLARMPALLTRPRLLARGAGWVLRIAGARVPVLFRHGVRRAEGADVVSRVVLAPVDRDGGFTGGPEHVLEADALAVGHGLVPGAEVARLLRVPLYYASALGGWVPRLDAHGRTGLSGLYAAGDGAGIRGAIAAVASGRRAGLAAAADAGVATHNVPDTYRTTAFSTAMAQAMALRPAQVAAIPSDTVVCRCEDVTRADIDAAATAGATDMNQLKQVTRCGMGPCQGRMCGDVAGELLARACGVAREHVGVWTARPPLRPLPLADLLGQFDYADIPIPDPAPL